MKGISLAYALDSPLEACGTAAAYAAYPNAVAVLVSNPLFIFHPPTFSNYSATLPIYVAYDTVGTYPFKTGTPLFISTPAPAASNYSRPGM